MLAVQTTVRQPGPARHRRQLLLRYAEECINWPEGIELVGKAEATEDLTVLDEPSQDAKVRLETQPSACADDALSLELMGWRIEGTGQRPITSR